MHSFFQSKFERLEVLRLAGVLAACFILAVALPVLAQKQTNPRDPQPAAAPGAGGPGVGLDTNTFTVEQLGVSIQLPLEALVTVQKAEGNPVVTITDSREFPAWSMRIQTITSKLHNPTAAGQIDDLLRQFQQSGRQFKLIANTAVDYGGVTSQLCYVEMAGSDDQKVVSGWLILPQAGEHFIVVTMQMVAEDFSASRSLLESSFATLRLRSPESIAADRRLRLESGRSLLASLSPQRLKTLVGTNQFFRLHSPDAQGKGSTEIGYSQVEAFEGKKGAIDPKWVERSADAESRKPGLMVRVQSRVVGSVERGVFYDSYATYWMAWDQSEEAWSIIATKRQGKAEASEAETGIRSVAVAGPVLTVIKNDNTLNDRKVAEWPVPDVYLSQALHWLSGKIMPKDTTGEQEFSFYFYNFIASPPQLSLRVDTWGPASDGSGNFRLVTRFSSDTPPMIATYDRTGNLVRRTQGNNIITEPIDLKELVRIWQSKGLPTGKIGG